MDDFIEKLNSMTKYPSIKTYHKMGEKGILLDETQCERESSFIITEKVDGTNARIIVADHPTREQRYFIGSREELLYAQGDIIHNPSLGIVDTLRSFADTNQFTTSKLLYQTIDGKIVAPIFVAYLEVFGGKLPATKQYSQSGATSVRLFDLVRIRPKDVLMLLGQPIREIAAWRDGGGQEFLTEVELEQFAEQRRLELTPRLGFASILPKSIEDTHHFLMAYGRSRCNFDGGQGKSEGVVCRSHDRKHIVKLRFEDYEKTQRKKK